MQRDVIEPFGVSDTFVSELADVELVSAGVYRFTFTAWQGGERIVTAKLVMPADALPMAIRMAARSSGVCVCEAVGVAVH